MRLKVGVIGGGLMGLALAFRLAGRGHAVTVFEREAQVGGLTTWQSYGPFDWDRFYHVILPSDVHLIRFLRDLGLGDRLRWKRTLTGFFVDRAFHSMSSNLEFLRFPPLGLVAKARLAMTILYCSRIDDWQRLESVPVGEWLERLGGRATYEKIWEPLLLAKLGESHRRVSAVFIWSYIKRMFSAREGSAQKEQLGYVSGGYKTVFTTLLDAIARQGGEVRTGITVERIAPRGQGGIEVRCPDRTDVFDKVVFTSPANVLRDVAASGLATIGHGAAPVEYLGVICIVLLTRRPLTPYYIVNIADARIPFTGIIGMGNLVAVEETSGLHMTFLPKYLEPDSPLFGRPDHELRRQFLDGLRLMIPELDDLGVVSVHVNRARRVQPLQVLGYSGRVPRVASEHPDFFVLNTSQFTHTTLNNNEVVRAVEEFLPQCGFADTRT